jgi:hypothetical protein
MLLSQSDPIELQERLQNPEEIFTLAEVHQAFDFLGPDYGWRRDDQIPAMGTVRTFALTVPDFEYLGVIIVRLLTGQDRLITIPNLRDKALGDNFNPSQMSLVYAETLAQTSCAIVSPPDLVDTLLRDEDPEAVAFFFAFSKEYKALVDEHAATLREKKSLRVRQNSPDGNASASTSETAETSSPPTQDGLE